MSWVRILGMLSVCGASPGADVSRLLGVAGSGDVDAVDLISGVSEPL